MTTTASVKRAIIILLCTANVCRTWGFTALHRSPSNIQHSRSPVQVPATNKSNDETETNSKRRSFLGLAVPLAFAVVANAPTIAVILNPPTADQREEMLTQWCKSDYCTLLQGGAGFVDANSAVSGSYNSDLVLPSPEEYAEQAMLAAERQGLYL